MTSLPSPLQGQTLVSKVPDMERVLLPWLAIPQLIAALLLVWGLDKAAAKTACSSSWVGTIQSIAAGLCFGLLNTPFKIIAGS